MVSLAPPNELIHIMIRKCGYALYNPHCGPVVISVSMQSIMSAMFGLYHTGAAKTVLQSLCTRLWCSLVAVGITLVRALSLHWRHNERHGVSITAVSIVFSIVYSIVGSGTDQRKHQSSASLAFVRGIHRWPVNSPHKRPVMQKMFPFDDVIMTWRSCDSSECCMPMGYFYQMRLRHGYIITLFSARCDVTHFTYSVQNYRERREMNSLLIKGRRSFLQKTTLVSFPWCNFHFPIFTRSTVTSYGVRNIGNGWSR